MIRLNLNVFVFAGSGAHQGLGQVSDNLFICFIHLTPVPLTALMTVLCVIKQFQFFNYAIDEPSPNESHT